MSCFFGLECAYLFLEFWYACSAINFDDRKNPFLKKIVLKFFKGALLLSVREGAKTQEAYIPGGLWPLCILLIYKKNEKMQGS